MRNLHCMGLKYFACIPWVLVASKSRVAWGLAKIIVLFFVCRLGLFFLKMDISNEYVLKTAVRLFFQQRSSHVATMWPTSDRVTFRTIRPGKVSDSYGKNIEAAIRMRLYIKQILAVDSSMNIASGRYNLVTIHRWLESSSGEQSFVILSVCEFSVLILSLVHVCCGICAGSSLGGKLGYIWTTNSKRKWYNCAIDSEF